ncbi:hypothetical protein HF521_021804 [Silurus meridionalis]|uniref:Hexosyltransferase n=1 Tax=Silurus meridionalis TaxID=175797 RepID=A0A8T0BC66_SILME|nr:hypothetical protein HF521_021804 [Silurus meridionalis]
MYGDILQWDYRDSFFNLTIKEGLSPAKARDLFVGDVITNAGPHRDKKVKYYIPESIYVGGYPPYAGGGGYLYSGKVAQRLHGIMNRVPLYPIDDVYTGMCLRKLGLSQRSTRDSVLSASRRNIGTTRAPIKA